MGQRLFLALLSLFTIQLAHSQLLKLTVKPGDGDWFPWGQCPKGTYAYGFQLKSEPLGGTGLLREETLVNAVLLHCSKPETNPREKLQVSGGEGPAGHYGRVFECREDAWIVGFRAALVSWGPGESKAISNIGIYCSDGRQPIGDGPDDGVWYTIVPTMCQHGNAVCAVRGQLTPKKGIADDTALNNLEMKCCEM